MTASPPSCLCISRRPGGRQDFRLLQHRLRRLLLLVRRIPVLAQDAPDKPAQVRPHVLAQRPVDGDVAADGLDQLAGDADPTGSRPRAPSSALSLVSSAVVEGQLVLGHRPTRRRGRWPRASPGQARSAPRSPGRPRWRGFDSGGGFPPASRRRTASTSPWPSTIGWMFTPGRPSGTTRTDSGPGRTAGQGVRAFTPPSSPGSFTPGADDPPRTAGALLRCRRTGTAGGSCPVRDGLFRRRWPDESPGSGRD